MPLPLVIVAAIAENGVIGRDNKLLWRLKTDLRHYREITWGKPMIMGRKTFQSIGRALPGRESIVLTRDKGFSAQGIHVAASWAEAVAKAEDLARKMGGSEIIVAGGSEIYALALPAAQRMRLTKVLAMPEGDAVFPSFDPSLFREAGRVSYPAGPDDEYAFAFVDLERREEAEKQRAR